MGTANKYDTCHRCFELNLFFTYGMPRRPTPDEVCSQRGGRVPGGSPVKKELLLTYIRMLWIYVCMISYIRYTQYTTYYNMISYPELNACLTLLLDYDSLMIHIYMHSKQRAFRFQILKSAYATVKCWTICFTVLKFVLNKLPENSHPVLIISRSNSYIHTIIVLLNCVQIFA